jgi:hypothetical protein
MTIASRLPPPDFIWPVSIVGGVDGGGEVGGGFAGGDELPPTITCVMALALPPVPRQVSWKLVAA